MAKSTAFSFFHILCYTAIIFSQVYAVKLEKQLHLGSNSKSNLRLFVFGDSYVDTGNWRKSISSSWKEPYGSTFPGKPTGRFSDGCVLTDYIGLISIISFTIIQFQWPFGYFSIIQNPSTCSKLPFFF